MNVFRIWFEVAGGHVHCRLFCAPRPDHTFAKCGDFVVRKGPEFVDLTHYCDIEFRPQEGSTWEEACKP